MWAVMLCAILFAGAVLVFGSIFGWKAMLAIAGIGLGIFAVGRLVYWMMESRGFGAFEGRLREGARTAREMLPQGKETGSEDKGEGSEDSFDDDLDALIRELDESIEQTAREQGIELEEGPSAEDRLRWIEEDQARMRGEGPKNDDKES